MQVPLKYANQTVTGMEYLVSFGIGAAAATAAAAAMHFAVSHYYRWYAFVLTRDNIVCHHSAGTVALPAGITNSSSQDDINTVKGLNTTSEDEICALKPREVVNFRQNFSIQHAENVWSA